MLLVNPRLLAAQNIRKAFPFTSYPPTPGRKVSNKIEVSLDYLVGNSDTELDAPMLERIQQVAQLGEEDKKLIYTFLDSFIDQARIKGILK